MLETPLTNQMLALAAGSYGISLGHFAIYVDMAIKYWFA